MSSASPAARQAAITALDAVAVAIGVPLELDANDQCGLAFDGDVEVVLALSPADDMLGLHARVASLGQAPSSEVLRRALALNDGRLPLGMALSMQAHSGQLKVLARVPLLDIEPAALVALLADLVALVPDVRAELGLDDAEAAPANAPSQANLVAPFAGALRI